MPIKHFHKSDLPTVDISNSDSHVGKVPSSGRFTTTAPSLSSHDPASYAVSHLTAQQDNPSLSCPQHLSSQDTASTSKTSLYLEQSDPAFLSSHDTAGAVNDTVTEAVTPAVSAVKLWDLSSQTCSSRQAAVNIESTSVKPKICQQSLLTCAGKLSPQIEPVLPFSSVENLGDLCVPAKPIIKPRFLKDMFFSLPNGSIFMDKVLPSPGVSLTEHKRFDAQYYISLYEQTAAAGVRGQYKWPENTPNYIGARVPLVHTSFNLQRWRYHLTGYHSPEIIQFLEYGFPLGLNQLPELSPALSNHGSAYQFYPWLDKFFSSGLLKGGVSGPCATVPFCDAMISPLMTADKKPSSRRAVYDATYGQYSLNNATPCEYYMGVKTVYTYPKVDDFRDIVLKCGTGCWLWKRDLARYYLQLPLDPTEFRFTGAVWRGLFFFLTALMFGLRFRMLFAGSTGT